MALSLFQNDMRGEELVADVPRNAGVGPPPCVCSVAEHSTNALAMQRLGLVAVDSALWFDYGSGSGFFDGYDEVAVSNNALLQGCAKVGS